MWFPSVRQLMKWSAVYLLFVLAGLMSLDSVSAKEISEISVDFIEDGKNREAIIDFKENVKKTKKHKKKKKKAKETMEDLTFAEFFD